MKVAYNVVFALTIFNVLNATLTITLKYLAKQFNYSYTFLAIFLASFGIVCYLLFKYLDKKIC